MSTFLNSAKNVAIFRVLQLGDILCSIPAIRALKLAKPNLAITFIGLAHTRDLIDRYVNYIDDFIDFPGYVGLPEQPYEKHKFVTFCKEVSDKNFDFMFQMQGNGNIVNKMLQSINTGQLAGFCKSIYEQNEFMLAYPEKLHEIHRHLSLMHHLGIKNDDANLEFPITYNDIKDFEKLSIPYKENKYLVIHPGSRGDWRQWPPLFFGAIADHCIQQGYSVILTGTANEKQIVAQVVSAMQNNCLNLCGLTNLGTMAVLLQKSLGLISNCTGVSHLAVALKKRSVVISMDGEPHRWAPLNKELHYTIDWCTMPEYRFVLTAVNKLLKGN